MRPPHPPPAPLRADAGPGGPSPPPGDAPAATRLDRLLNPRNLAAFYAVFWGLHLVIAVAACLWLAVPHPVAAGVINAGSWMLIGTAGLAVGWAMPVDRRPRAWQLVGLLLGSAGLVVLRLVLITLAAPAFGWSAAPLDVAILAHLQRHLLIATSFVALGCGLRQAARRREEVVRMAQLDALLANARLVALRTHLRPRMLLQAMRSIADEISTDAPRADARLVAFSELLRQQLARAQQHRVPLHQELDFIARYLEVDRGCSGAPTELHVVMDRGAREVPVPPNCVSLLVESVLGARVGAAPTLILVEARLVEGELEITVRDDCPVPLRARPLVGEEAMRELAESLRAELGPGAAPELADRPEGGAVSRVRLPLGARGARGEAVHAAG